MRRLAATLRELKALTRKASDQNQALWQRRLLLACRLDHCLLGQSVKWAFDWSIGWRRWRNGFSAESHLQHQVVFVSMLASISAQVTRLLEQRTDRNDLSCWHLTIASKVGCVALQTPSLNRCPFSACVRPSHNHSRCNRPDTRSRPTVGRMFADRMA